MEPNGPTPLFLFANTLFICAFGHVSPSFFYSQRTANRMLANLAASHTDKVVEMKKKAEVVIAAPTNKQASALARLDDSGGWSYHSDNVAKVQPRDVCVKFV